MLSPLQLWVGEKTGLGPSMDVHTLERFQFLRLREQLCYARAHSPYYSGRLQGLDIERIRERIDLCLLPLTPADALREKPEKLVCISGSQAARITTLNTSGSSGDTKRVWFSQADLDRTIDFFAQGMATMTRPGQAVLVLLSGSSPDSLGDLLGRALKRIGVKPVIHGPVRDVPTALLAAEKVSCIVGLPVQVNRLCLSSSGLRPATVLLTADYVPEGITNNVKSLWGSEVFTHYGLTESGFGLAVQCQAHEALHLRDAEFIIDIIDPVSGQLLPDGQWGELVLTSLCNEAMPLIRYRTGDVTRRVVEPCACGGILPRLDKIMGRVPKETTNDSSNLIGQNSIQTLDEALFSLPGLVDYRVDNLSENALALTLDGLSTYSEEELRRALMTQGLEPPVLEFREEALPVFYGAAKRGLQKPQLDF